MENLNIDDGTKRIMINDDPTRVIEFNPSDVVWVEKFQGLRKDFAVKELEFKKRCDEVDSCTDVDENGIPVNFEARVALLREVCEFIREKIDQLFGAGTSKKAFGDTLNLDMFEQFFNGITPFIQAARNKKMAAYINENSKVMK